MTRWFLKLLLIVVIAAVAGIGFGWQQVQQQLKQPLAIAEATEITIPPGQSVRRLIKEWQANGWIESATWLRLGLELKPELTQIKAGTFELTPGTTTTEALLMLKEGLEKQFYITLVDGETTAQWLSKLHQHNKITKTLKSPDDLNKVLGIDASEGWFLPETYAFVAGTSELAILKRSHKAMQNALNQSWEHREQPLPLKSPYEMLILASIIEKETGQPSERPMVSSVFINRLNTGMRLQTDPTVIYGMGDEYQGRITRKALNTKTPYNTYRIDGLPPTPIANPSLASLEAAAKPDQTDYVYFVAKGDGTHHFSVSLREHNNAVNKYIRKRK